MKLISSLLVLASLGVFTPSLFADPMLTVNAGVTGGTLVETPIANGFTWIYTDNATTLYSVVPLSTTSDSNVFTATFTDVGGVALLNVNDVCANVAVNHANNSCALGFTFTDAGLGTPVLLSNASALGILGVNASADTLGLTVGASVGGGSAQFGFNPPPSATPEPGTLSLLGTALLGAGGVVRKKFFAA